LNANGFGPWNSTGTMIVTFSFSRDLVKIDMQNLSRKEELLNLLDQGQVPAFGGIVHRQVDQHIF